MNRGRLLYLLAKLHGGDPVHEKTAAPVVSLVHSDGVAGLVELVGRRQPAGPTPHYRDFLASAGCRRRGLDPAPLEPRVDDAALDILDGDGWRVNAKNTASLARSGTHPAGELEQSR